MSNDEKKKRKGNRECFVVENGLPSLPTYKLINFCHTY